MTDSAASAASATVEPNYWASFAGSTNFANAAIGMVGDYFKGKVSKYQAQTQAAVAKTKYWTQMAHTNKTNYRNYERQLKSWYRQADYTEKMKEYESKREKQQAVYKGRVSELATENFAKKMADLDGQFYEQEAKDDLEMDEIRLKNVAASAKKAAGGQVGRTINSMRQQYNQQYQQNLGNRQITREWRLADKMRAAQALNVARENTNNQVQFYTPQPQADPVKPLAPIPAEGYEPPDAISPSTNLLALNIGGKIAGAFLDYKDSLTPKQSATETDR